MKSPRPFSLSLIESLEARVAPAGIIDIIAGNGNAVLKVAGNTDTAQDITIAGSLDGELTITGNDGETFRVNGVPGSGPVTLTGIVGSLSVDLGKNDDSLLLTGVSLGGALTLKMGDGANATTITNSAVGSVSYLGGTGVDTLVAASFDVAGKVALKLSAGDNSVQFSATVRIGGDLAYTGGANADTLSATNELITIGGNLVFKGAAGPSSLSLDSDTVTIGKNFSFLAGINTTATAGNLLLFGTDLLRIGGSFTYVNPTGKQSITVSSSGQTQIAGSITLTAGPTEGMTANFAATDVFTAGAVTLTGKSANLTVSIAAPSVAIGGNIITKNLRGFALTGSGVVSGAVNLTVGQGGILLSSPAEDLLITGKALLKTIATSSQNTSIVLERVQFSSTVIATLSAGVDSFIADNITAFGAFTLTSGTSADTVSIERNDVAGRSVFYGPVTLNLGPGFDILQVGDNDPNKQVIAYRSFNILGGKTNNMVEAISILNGNIFLVPPVIT